MDYISNKIKDLELLEKEVPQQAEIIAKKYKDEILDFIREDQLFNRGIDGQGKSLQRYANYTIGLKKLKGQPTNRTTLFDTGSFTEKMDLLFTDQNSIGVFSRDLKTPELISKYGQNIFTFTVQNNKIINEDIFLKNLIKWILNTPTFTKI